MKKLPRQLDLRAGAPMTAKDFTGWLAFMVMKGVAKSDAEAAELLGVHKNTLSRWKKHGAPATVALVCAAIDRGLPPWKLDHAFM